MINAGKLRHRVIIQRPVEQQNQSTGDMVVSWVNVATVWAEIAPLSAREMVSAQVESSKVNTRITIRYREDISHEMRLIHESKNKIYNIEGILSDLESGLEYITIPASQGLRYIENNNVISVILENPQINGNPVIGQLLTATTGLWANDPIEYSYQWYLNDLPVVGATSNTFSIDADIDDIITVGIIASNSAGDSVEAFSDGVLIIE